MKIISQSTVSVYPLLGRGKVRDIFEIDDRTLLIVTTDRMSAFDVVLSEPVPYKGVVLNQLTLFWMKKFDSIIPNPVLEWDISRFPKALDPWKDELEGRAVIVRKADPLPLECIVRGYLAGSGWDAYQKTGEICGHKLPAGMEEAQKITPPIFTPSTKAPQGKHDENISQLEAQALVGDEAGKKAALLSLSIYEAGAAHALENGIIVADTKFELGYIDGTLHLIDEVLTPDSSRFWPKAGYESGKAQPSYDKQFLRDWLKQQNWNKKAPAPVVPREIIETTADKYREIYKILTGESLAV